MFKFTRTRILYLITTIIFIIIHIFINQYKIKTEIEEEIMNEKKEFTNVVTAEQSEEMEETEQKEQTEENEQSEQTEQIQIEKPEKKEDVATKIITKQNQEENKSWKIEIPKISIIADIKEGTNKDILNKYVGHFTETRKEYGNIGLAAHNRGYEVNYFKDLKLLEKGDIIKYTYNEFIKIYEVEKCRIIKDTDWTYLENTEENRLTLITCVENQPEYRRCIQAVEKEKERY